MYRKPECELRDLSKQALVKEILSLGNAQGFDFSKERLNKVPRKVLELAIARCSANIIAEHLNPQPHFKKTPWYLRD